MQKWIPWYTGTTLQEPEAEHRRTFNESQCTARIANRRERRSIKDDVKSKHIFSANGKNSALASPFIDPTRSACVIITECQTMNPKSPKASSRKSPARVGKSVQRWNSGNATKMRVSRSMERTEERTLKIANAGLVYVPRFCPPVRAGARPPTCGLPVGCLPPDIFLAAFFA